MMGWLTSRSDTAAVEDVVWAQIVIVLIGHGQHIDMELGRNQKLSGTRHRSASTSAYRSFGRRLAIHRSNICTESAGEPEN